MTGEDGGRAKMRQKPQKSYGRDVQNGGDLSDRRKIRRQEGVDSVDVDRGYLENI